MVGESSPCGISVCSILACLYHLERRSRATHRTRQRDFIGEGCGTVMLPHHRLVSALRLFRAGSWILLLSTGVAGCAHSAPSLRPTHRVSYWEALAELHPGDAIAAARTPSEREFAEALENLISGDLEKAEQRFGTLRVTATDSVLRMGSRVIYVATLQYQEKWKPLSTLKNEPTEPKADRTDKASIELWADAFKDLPPKTFTFRSPSARLQMSISAVGTPLVPVRIGERVYHFWLDTGSSLTMLASNVARDLGIPPLVPDTLEIVTSTGRIKAQPSLIPLLEIGPLAVRNAPSMIVDESLMQMREPKPIAQSTRVKLDGIIGFDILRQLDLELDYSENILRLRNPANSRPEGDRNMFWVGLPVIRLTSLDDIPLHFGLDTGAQQTFVTETLLDKLQLKAKRIESRRVGGLGGEISLRAPVMPDLQVLVR